MSKQMWSYHMNAKTQCFELGHQISFLGCHRITIYLQFSNIHETLLCWSVQLLFSAGLQLLKVHCSHSHICLAHVWMKGTVGYNEPQLFYNTFILKVTLRSILSCFRFRAGWLLAAWRKLKPVKTDMVCKYDTAPSEGRGHSTRL